MRFLANGKNSLEIITGLLTSWITCGILVVMSLLTWFKRKNKVPSEPEGDVSILSMIADLSSSIEKLQTQVNKVERKVYRDGEKDELIVPAQSKILSLQPGDIISPDILQSLYGGQ